LGEKNIHYYFILKYRLRKNIKDASMTDLRDFLENVRKHSPLIGGVAMKQVRELLISFA
jgi:hypothetical protein